MKFSALSSLALLALRAVAAPGTSPESELNKLISQIQNSQLEDLKPQIESLGKRGVNPACNIRNVVIRKEYGSLSKAERLNYISAVKCLQKKPARTPAAISEGAKSRYDDFIVTHILQSFTIHSTGNFLAWHRWYLYVYEQALRNECGYKGYAPYWDWPKYASAPQDSPIFNGDRYSIGSNGKYIPHNGTVVPPQSGEEFIFLPPGLGGGCVERGPFSDMSVNLGPVGLLNGEPAGPNGGLGYNPRCLKRDIGPGVSTRYNNASAVRHLLLTKNIVDFRAFLEGVPNTQELGPHGGGHFTVNGDPGGDFFVSPGDPGFYLHHGQVDRMWAYWQALDPKNRQNALTGTRTFFNNPPSADTTLDDIIELGDAGPSVRLGDIMSTTSGPLCYIYI